MAIDWSGISPKMRSVPLRRIESAAQTFTISTATGPGQNLTAAGTIIARVTALSGGGSRNIQIIRDGVTPAAGTAIWLKPPAITTPQPRLAR